MLNKFFKFLRGYVIISVSGKKTERFLNICTRRGMRVYKAEPSENGITIKIASADFIKIRDIARKCRVRVKIKEKHSASHTLRLYRSRYAFVIAATVCAFLCVLSTRFIWLVEINGADEDNIDSITATLDEMGVKRGGIKSRLPDGMEMKSRILNGTDNVAWAWVYIEGAKARVEIYEKIMPPAVIDKSVPCDILASCGGVIKSMTVKNGEERVKEGDAVNAGDVLVSGNVSAYREGAEENYIKVHAMADIYAYTTHTASDDFKLYYETRTPTGRYRRHIVLDWFGKTISLPWREVNFEEYDRAEKRRELNTVFRLFGYSC